jgi:hypothetical protein
MLLSSDSSIARGTGLSVVRMHMQPSASWLFVLRVHNAIVRGFVLCIFYSVSSVPASGGCSPRCELCVIRWLYKSRC